MRRIALIVEDDTYVRSFLNKVLLKKFNFETIEASNGLEGLTLLEKHSPEIVFIDISMPFLNGIEMIDAIKENPKYNKIPLIVVTANNDAALIKKLLLRGVNEYLLKPIDFHALIERITNILQIKRQNAEKKESTLVKPVSQINRILFANSNIEFVEKLKPLFNNIEILKTKSGAEALKMYIDYRPKVIFVGNNLEMLSSEKLIEKIKEFDEGSGSKIIYLKEDKSNDSGSPNLFNVNNLENMTEQIKRIENLFKK